MAKAFFVRRYIMDSIIWLALAVLFAIAEMTTVNLVTIWFALGALIALIFSMFGIDFVWQMWIFILSAVAFLVLTKPLVKNKLDAKKESTNAQSLIGKTAIVTEDISSDKFAGQVKISGMDWSAVCHEEELIKKGTKVKIIKVEGVKLVVERYHD